MKRLGLHLCLLTFLASALVWAHSGELVSDEMVPFTFNGKVECYDAYPGDEGNSHRFPTPAHPGYLRMNGRDKAIIDQTSRVSGLYAKFEIPPSAACSMLESNLAKIPSELVARRRVYRRLDTPLWERQNVIAVLYADIEIELPFQLEGKPAVLKGSQGGWASEVVQKNGLSQPLTLPQLIDFKVRIHPQSATFGVGLFCSPSAKSATEHHLSFGGTSDRLSYFSNVGSVKHRFDSKTSCEEARSTLMSYYKKEDPQNDGTIFTVARELKSAYQKVLDRDGKDMCLEIQQDVAKIVPGSWEFTGTKESFPIRSVDLQFCGL